MDKKQKKKLIILTSVFFGVALLFVVGSAIFLKDKEEYGLFGKDKALPEGKSENLENQNDSSVATAETITENIEEQIEDVVQQVLLEEDYLESESSLFK